MKRTLNSNEVFSICALIFAILIGILTASHFVTGITMHMATVMVQTAPPAFVDSAYFDAQLLRSYFLESDFFFIADFAAASSTIKIMLTFMEAVLTFVSVFFVHINERTLKRLFSRNKK